MREYVRTYSALIFLLYSAAQDVGEICSLKDGSVGTCEHISNCTSAQRELQQRLRPSICGFDKILPIVCCGDNRNAAQVRITSGISEEKCKEYLQLNIRSTITTTTTDASLKVQYAFGGVNAQYEEFPHMALLGYGTGADIKYQCGGSLISDQFVLTAAHCLESRDSGAVSVIRVGELDIASTTELAEPQDFNVVETYSHPEYDFESFYNDIALIKLDRPVIYTRYVKPACLQFALDLEHNNLTATGWGALEYGGESHTYLQKVELNSFPIKNCLPTYGPQTRLSKGIDDELQICAGNLKRPMDTCQGDSGGPLQLKIKGLAFAHRVVGITSFGSNCGLVPGVYTRVSRYISWIESIVWPN